MVIFCWDFEDFADKCEATEAGETFVESWACINSEPQNGDEVFLIKLGEQPRGIIGHGIVVQTAYQKPHYDAAKAAAGQMEQAIDVKFDRLINYEIDNYLSQDELKRKCPAQFWSPQGSGIEIRPEVLPILHELWDGVTLNNKKYGFAEMVSFLADYTGEHYTVPEKAGEKAEYMEEMRRRGQQARGDFTAFCQEVAKNVPGLEYAWSSNWINQGQVVPRYLWVELKSPKWLNYPQSVSLSVEDHNDVHPGEGYFLSIRAETKDSKSSTLDYKRQKRLLDCKLLDGMYYLVSYKNGEYHNLGTDTEKAKILCRRGTVEKLQIMKGIDDLPQKDKYGTILNTWLPRRE